METKRFIKTAKTAGESGVYTIVDGFFWLIEVIQQWIEKWMDDELRSTRQLHNVSNQLKQMYLNIVSCVVIWFMGVVF